MKKTTLFAHKSLYAEAQKKCEDLKRIRCETEERLLKYPEGKIHIVNKNANVKYYLRTEKTDKSGVYLSKSNKELIKLYNRKSYDEKLIRLINREISALEDYLSRSGSIDEQIRQLYSLNPDEVKAYLDPVDVTDEDYTDIWLRKPYKGKEIGEDVPYYKTELGERVRSKSELNIANSLARRKIPYKYECPLRLKNNVVVYPDFTILNAEKRELFYWEHRGMMDDMDYTVHAVNKIKSYMKNGILQGRNLIITEETSSRPLGTDEIENIISAFFAR